MPYQDNFEEVEFINKSVQATGTPDVSAQWLNGFQAAVKEISTALADTSSLAEALDVAVDSIGTPFADTTLIKGLKPEYISPTQIRITTGFCYIPASGSIVSQSSNATIAPSGLVADTMYYIYAQDVGGNIAFNVDTQAPVAYMGTAKHKSGASSFRYIGEFRTDNNSTAIMRFTESDDEVFYIWDGLWSAPLNITNGGSNITAGAAELLGTNNCLPVGCKMASFFYVALGQQNLWFGAEDVAISTVTSTFLTEFDMGSGDERMNGQLRLPIGPNRQIRYRFDASGGDLWMGVASYKRER